MCTYATFSRNLFRFRTYKKHRGVHPSLYEEKMKPQTVKSAVLSVRCAYHTSDGRQCRESASGAHTGLCPQHRASHERELAADHFKHLTTKFQFFQTAQGINFSLMNLYQLLAQNRISPRRAAVLAYINSLLLRTLPQIDADNDAGISDPTNLPAKNLAETSTASVQDEATVLNSDPSAAPESTSTWDPSNPEPDPKKKPS
jgi:hypothetical protein